jgi:hypothetical protein
MSEVQTDEKRFTEAELKWIINKHMFKVFLQGVALGGVLMYLFVLLFAYIAGVR